MGAHLKSDPKDILAQRDSHLIGPEGALGFNSR